MSAAQATRDTLYGVFGGFLAFAWDRFSCFLILGFSRGQFALGDAENPADEIGKPPARFGAFFDLNPRRHCGKYTNLRMHVFYLDESYDSNKFVVSAFGFRAERWRALLVAIQDFRRSLRDDFGIKITREIHASAFIRDCGDRISTRKLNLGQRKRVFELCLRKWASFAPNVQVINVCLSVSGHGGLETAHFRAIQRSVNRIDRTMKEKGSHAILIFDEGKERQITGMLRRMAVFNPIPSQYTVWPDGSSSKNIAVLRIIEDAVFRQSNRSYFLQCADHVAFTLLKRETNPAPFIKRWGYHLLFPILNPLRFLPACPSDPDGISR